MRINAGVRWVISSIIWGPFRVFFGADRTAYLGTPYSCGVTRHYDYSYSCFTTFSSKFSREADVIDAASILRNWNWDFHAGWNKVNLLGATASTLSLYDR